ncbi:TOK1 [Candida theae]|uniref:TOK1 n=1 Tax=Candida theae TaxID=1198502 RepID=A0AAD5BGW6_9ASCO|nr:TOK1 [Candida theae]KAI5962717.1 TOK1 [Candida theae]
MFDFSRSSSTSSFKDALKRASTSIRPQPLSDKRAIESIQRYQDILSPILINTNTLSRSNDKISTSHRRKMAPVSIKHALNLPLESILNLYVRPGEPHFVMWFMISSYFPLTAACLGPLSNMISIIALIEHWRVDTETGVYHSDPRKVVILNAMSLAFGLIGNISLLMNFSRSVKYLITQCISIFSWFCACMLLVAGILITNYQALDDYTNIDRSEGFYCACFTAAYYFVCMVILLVNFAGYRLNKYPATFNLDQKQRTLMVYTILFSAWSVAGAVALAHLIKGISYGSALYYCIVSLLTIGLGDIIPETSGAKVVALTFSFVGVLIMGLIVATLRSVILSSAAPAVFWNDTELKRRKYVEKRMKSNRPITPEEAFHQIRRIRSHVKTIRANIGLLTTILIFLVYWLLGGMVFHFIEGWSYFHSVYFCFLCLLTIGYGDFAPKTGLGRVFFISWAISAVPLMTILVSNVGDELYDISNRTSEWFSKWLFRPDSAYQEKKKIAKEIKEEHGDDVTINSSILADELLRDYDLTMHEYGDEASECKEDAEIEQEIVDLDGSDASGGANDPDAGDAATQTLKLRNVQHKISERARRHLEVLKYLERLKPLISDCVSNPMKKYTLKQWHGFFEILELDESPQDVQETRKYDGFWLGDYSPLRLPLKEPNFMVLKVYDKIEETVARLIDEEIDDLKLMNNQEGEEDVGPPAASDRKVQFGT